jgi:hypothetical protein
LNLGFGQHNGAMVAGRFVFYGKQKLTLLKSCNSCFLGINDTVKAWFWVVTVLFGLIQKGPKRSRLYSNPTIF